jgi:hypothetical protein
VSAIGPVDLDGWESVDGLLMAACEREPDNGVPVSIVATPSDAGARGDVGSQEPRAVP